MGKETVDFNFDSEDNLLEIDDAPGTSADITNDIAVSLDDNANEGDVLELPAQDPIDTNAPKPDFLMNTANINLEIPVFDAPDTAIDQISLEEVLNGHENIDLSKIVAPPAINMPVGIDLFGKKIVEAPVLSPKELVQQKIAAVISKPIEKKLPDQLNGRGLVLNNPIEQSLPKDTMAGNIKFNFPVEEKKSWFSAAVSGVKSFFGSLSAGFKSLSPVKKVAAVATPVILLTVAGLGATYVAVRGVAPEKQPEGQKVETTVTEKKAPKTANIESVQSVSFERGMRYVDEAAAAQIRNDIKDLKESDAQSVGRIIVRAHTSPDGKASWNKRLEAGRAEEMKKVIESEIKAQGLNISVVTESGGSLDKSGTYVLEKSAPVSQNTETSSVIRSAFNDNVQSEVNAPVVSASSAFASIYTPLVSRNGAGLTLPVIHDNGYDAKKAARMDVLSYNQNDSGLMLPEFSKI